MGPGWPGAGRQAACSPTSSVGAISTARTWRAFSAEAFVGSTVQSEGQQPHELSANRLPPPGLQETVPRGPGSHTGGLVGNYRAC